MNLFRKVLLISYFILFMYFVIKKEREHRIFIQRKKKKRSANFHFSIGAILNTYLYIYTQIYFISILTFLKYEKKKKHLSLNKINSKLQISQTFCSVNIFFLKYIKTCCNSFFFFNKYSLKVQK